MKRLRELIESIVFAGLKPEGQKAPAARSGWTGRLRDRIDRFLAGGPGPSDPLYLSNRTTSQKMRSSALIWVPCVILAIAAGIAFTILDPPEARPTKEMTAKEVATRVLPNLEKDIKLNTRADVQVVEVSVKHDGGSRLVGVVKNMTTHEIAAVDLTVELTDVTGTQVGAVNGTVAKLPASGEKTFAFPIKQREAAFALVREIAPR